MYYIIQHKKGVNKQRFRVAFAETGKAVRHVAELMDCQQHEADAIVKGLNQFLLGSEPIPYPEIPDQEEDEWTFYKVTGEL
jgi:hypothetical protein